MLCKLEARRKSQARRRSVSDADSRVGRGAFAKSSALRYGSSVVSAEGVMAATGGTSARRVKALGASWQNEYGRNTKEFTRRIAYLKRVRER